MGPARPYVGLALLAMATLFTGLKLVLALLAWLAGPLHGAIPTVAIVEAGLLIALLKGRTWARFGLALAYLLPAPGLLVVSMFMHEPHGSPVPLLVGAACTAWFGIALAASNSLRRLSLDLAGRPEPAPSRTARGLRLLAWAAVQLVACVLILWWWTSDPPAVRLARAAHHGRLNQVQALLQDGVPVDVALPDGRTALIVAARAGRLDVARVLLEAGADPSHATERGESPLSEAQLAGAARVELVRLLLAHGADLHADVGGFTALGRAAARGDRELVSLFIDAGAQVNASDRAGRTPLACLFTTERLAGADRDETAALLLAAGADVNVRDRLAASPLHRAMRHASGRTVRRLLEAGAVVDAQARGGGTPLLEAARHGRTEIVDLLLEAGADANRADDHGDTPLLAAVRGRHAAAAIRLVRAGASPDAVDALGRSARSTARETGQVGVVQAMENRDALLTRLD